MEKRGTNEKQSILPKSKNAFAAKPECFATEIAKRVEPNKDDKSIEDNNWIYDDEGGDGDSENKEVESSAAKPNTNSLGTKNCDESKEHVDESGSGDKEDESSVAKLNANTLATKMTDKSKECTSFNELEPSKKRPATSSPSESQKNATAVKQKKKAALYQPYLYLECLKRNLKDKESETLLLDLEKSIMQCYNQLQNEITTMEAEKVKMDEALDEEDDIW